MTRPQTLCAEVAEQHLAALISLLQDAVESGASIGFLPPLSEDEARVYWLEVIEELRSGQKILITAFSGEEALVGAVQLALATRANGLHRAEVQKLFVHRQARGQGIGHSLMATVEREALKLGRWLLVLDTRQGDTAEQLYMKIGYIPTGVIPAYAQNAQGIFEATVIFYKQLSTSPTLD
jgi:GNAT superfamily N-acetyltransferase